MTSTIQSDLSRLKPITVLGTGFLNQLLPNFANLTSDKQRKLNPLVNWSSLLNEVAFRHDLYGCYTPELAKHMPTLQWDEMVRAFAVQSSEKMACHKAEDKLKKTVIEILKDGQRETHENSLFDTHKLDVLLDVSGDHIVSLNFDSLLLGTNKSKPIIPDKQSHLLHFKQNNKTLWFPHGSIEDIDSIRLGLRQYGFLPNSWDKYLCDFKAYERSSSNDKKSSLTPLDFKVLAHSLAEGKEAPGHLLIGHLLLAPLILFGVGLSETEWGWWWLLNQRARNLTQIDHKLRPLTIIVIEKNDPRRHFWSLRPAGVSPIYVDDQDMGWEIFLEWLSKRGG
jgi:hypothetical protein